MKGVTDVVRIKQVPVVAVSFGVVVSFKNFFKDNSIDPAAINKAFQSQVPPSYAANYDPDNGKIVQSNPFVKNLASVLNINPQRIRVVNIVPGSHRRLLQLAESDPSRYEYHRFLESSDSSTLGVDFEIHATDECSTMICKHGHCNFQGACTCDRGWEGVHCDAPTGSSRKLTTGTVSPTLSPIHKPSPFQELINVGKTLQQSANTGALDTGYIVADAVLALPNDVCGVPGGDG